MNHAPEDDLDSRRSLALIESGSMAGAAVAARDYARTVQKVAWTLLPIALLGGAVAGYFGRGTQTKTTTVVQIQTVAAPPPATHVLTAIVQGSNGGCLTAASPDTDYTTHAWTLRRPGNGVTNGDVVGVAEISNSTHSTADIDITFKIAPSLGFFTVSDDSTSDSWGPFDSHQMAAHGWIVRLNK